MYETGDYLIPRLNQVPFLEKPPLTYWGIAAGMELLGKNEWGARAFHALCYILTVGIVGFFGAYLLGRRSAGWMSAIIYATMIIPYAAASVVTPDTPLALCTTTALFCFWQSAKPNARRIFIWKILMFAAFGAGFLAKGPAVLIPSGAIAIYLLAQGRFFSYFLSLGTLVGVVVFSSIGVTWYFLVIREIPEALSYFWDNQIWGRLVSHKYHRNPGLSRAVVIYLPILLLGSLPWSAVFLSRIRETGRTLFKKKWWFDLRNRPVELFLMTWILVPLLVLSLASSKLPLYVLPLFPALALGVTHRILQAKTYPSNLGFFGSTRRAMLLTLWAVILLGLKGGASYYPSDRGRSCLVGRYSGSSS